MTDITTTDQSKVLEAVESGTLAFSDLLRTVAKREGEPVEIPLDIPKQVAPTASQLVALETIPAVIEASQVPTERRLLETEEVLVMMEERLMLDDIAKLVEGRKEAQRAAIFNHFDLASEAAGVRADRDDKGHLLNKTEVVVPNVGKKFTRELREAAPVLTAEALLAMVDDPTVDFTHDDYLACTSQVRVLDEAKVLLYLRKRPEIMPAMGKATREGKVTASLYVRKA